ncbi:DegT/DnrJ/EryC1/StrS family aminotransferase [Azospirillum sp. HJ39]|uniref:DegT/DnrJ/EryC1/StrS family aminotransferase n=1 Tax=Azospirillum sp. HJ39 TaxID=3159496 RepID=UPI003558C2F0
MTGSPPRDDPESGKPLHVGQLNLPAEDAFHKAFGELFDRRFFANHGPLEQQLDRELALRFGTRHAVSVVNATVALMLALRALDLQGEVIVPAFTFPATVQAVDWAGLKPVFCDVDPHSQTLTAQTVAPRIGPATAAILGVHVWGRACDPDGLAELSRRHGLKLLFDAAHAVGAGFRGRPIGGFGDAEVFSFHATKILNGVEGGCIATNDDDLAARLRRMRSFHEADDGVTRLYRLNAKMSEAQAAMALLGLRDLDGLIGQNRRRYERYRQELDGIPGVRFVDYAGDEASNYQFIVLSVEPAASPLSRDMLLDRLRSRQILARRYFHPGMHRTPPYCDDGIPDLPVTERLCSSLIQLPTGQLVTDRDIETICAVIREAAGMDGAAAPKGSA